MKSLGSFILVSTIVVLAIVIRPVNAYAVDTIDANQQGLAPIDAGNTTVNRSGF
jgi:hypothetical protein